MPARIFSPRRRAYLGALLVLALATLGFTAVPASAATSSLCYLWPTTIIGAGHATTLTGQVLTGSHTAEWRADARLEKWSSGAWRPYNHRETDFAGKVAFWLAPPITVAVRLRFPGNAAHAPCVTPMITVWKSNDARVVAAVARHSGAAYSYGATGPSSFDCSGLMQYVIRRFGRVLPRTTQLQYNSMSHVAKAAVLPGDLIFFGTSMTSIYHVGMYAGAGQIWHAPAPGQRVKKQKIWTTAYYVGRL
ncbi:MAG: C40 family peptidase [Actinomycetota bacterium]|nr:C40 family peptidase [Actinomycetota bacterium]